MRKPMLVLTIVLVLLVVFSSVCYAGGKSADAPGHNKTPEADYGTGSGDDSAINKGKPSSDANNNDDGHENGRQRPNPPSDAAGRNGNCDNNGWDCGPAVQPPSDPPTVQPPRETPEIPTKETGGNAETGETETETRRVCWHSSGSVEVWDSLADFGNEDRIIGESQDRFCWDATLGTVYYILIWTANTGHGGPMYSLTANANGATVNVYNPFVGTVSGDGWTAKRLGAANASIVAE